MKAPLIIVLLVMTMVAIAIPCLADDCGCSDTGSNAGTGSLDTGTGNSGFGGDSAGDNAIPLATEGRILFGEGRYSESLSAYRSALVIDPNDASVWSGIGDALYALGNYTEAVDAYEHLIQLDPGDDATWYRKGNAYLALGEYKEAVAAYDRALAMNPSIANAKANRGIALSKIEAVESPRDAVTPVRLTTEVTEVNITPVTSDTTSIPESLTGTMRSGTLPLTSLAALCIICGLWITMSRPKR